ncbi:MAG: hypothetical protein ACI83Y_000544, partial [Candidatus Azotimanducaceae bacterium]
MFLVLPCRTTARRATVTATITATITFGSPDRR